VLIPVYFDGLLNVVIPVYKENILNDSAPTYARLKGLSSEICLAGNGINRQISLKRTGAKTFS
jgi:hypothetical protein